MKPITAKRIQRALYHKLQSGSAILCPNVYLYLWESDMVQITNSQYATEYEIKISQSDFKADFRKMTGWRGRTKKHDILASNEVPVFKDWSNKITPIARPSRFFFVAPEGIIVPEELPDYAGLLEIVQGRNGWLRVRRAKESKRHANAGKIKGAQSLKLMRSMMFRYWNLRLNDMELEEPPADKEELCQT